jgi:hypothetical protein
MRIAKKIALVAFLLLLLVCLGRETGLYDFHWTTSEAKSNLQSSVTKHNYRNGVRAISGVTETSDGASITFSDGTTGTLTINDMTYSGMYYLPFIKHIDASMKASFVSADGRIVAQYAATTSIDIKGSCSIRFAR